MGKAVKVRKIGNSYGVILPRSLLKDLGIEEGDTLYPAKTTNGIELTRHEPDFEAVLSSTRHYMRHHRNALRKLAKK